MDAIFTILTVWGVIAGVCTLAHFVYMVMELAEDGDPVGCLTFFLPNELHDITEMNWFGCTCISLLALVLDPIISIFAIIYLLFHI